MNRSSHPTRSSLPPLMGRQTAFTLTELLATVAVMIALVALLFPALQGVIERSRGTACTSQLRNIGTGLLAYCADHEGKLIPAAAIADNYFWFDALNPYMGYPQYDRNYSYPGVTAEGKGFPLPWQQCPAQRQGMTQRQQVGYGWNHIHFGYKAWSAAFNSNSILRQVTEPSATIIIGDSKDATVDPGQDFQYRYIGLEVSEDIRKLARRHAGRGNYLMLDGHVQSFIPEEIPRVSRYWKKK